MATGTGAAFDTDMQIRRGLRVLVPLDGSELAAAALPVAESLCQRAGGELELVRILPPVVSPFVSSEAYIPAEVYEQMERDQDRNAHDYLERVATTAREHGLRVHNHIGSGDAATGLLDWISNLHINLVVMSTHGRTGLVRFALGSVADRVVRSGTAPVLLVRSFPGAAQTPTLTHALVPVDGSALAESSVIPVIVELAGSVLRQVTLLRVVDPRDGDEGMAVARGYLAALQQRLIGRLVGRDCSVNRLVRVEKNPATAILEVSQNEGCDMVLMATHGEAGIGRVAFGSVTDHVLRDGQTPLLLVHPAHD